MSTTQSSDEFTGFFVAAVFFGFVLQSSFQCIRAFMRQKQNQWVSYFVATALHALVVIDMSLAVVQQFKILRCCPQDGEDCSHIPWHGLVKSSIVALSSLLVEGVLIYRCWVVYFRRWVAVVVPILFWVSGLAMITYTIYVEGKLEKQKSFSQRKAGDSVHTAFWALMSLVNVITTTLIISRIVYVDSNVTGNRSWIKPVRNPQTPLQSVVQTVVGSGLMCLFASLFVLAGRLTGGIFSGLASSMMILISALSFNLIIIRKERNARKPNKGFAQSTRVSNLLFDPNSLTTVPRTKSWMSSTFGKESFDTSGSLLLPKYPVAHVNIRRLVVYQLELRFEPVYISCSCCTLSEHFPASSNV